MENERRAPGLRFNGKRPVWRASKKAIAAGYPLKSVHLSSLAGEPARLRERCERLQAEMETWLQRKSSTANADPQFDGTFRSLFDLYQIDRESPYQKLKRSSRVPYDVYLRMMRKNIGGLFIDAADGRDVKRWFASWSEPAEGKTKRQVAKARMAIYVLKAALSFGILCRKRGCVEFRAVLDAIRFETLKPRDIALTADVVVKARAAAHEIGHPRAAFCYAIQFEGAVRQWDVTGQWFPISDPQPSTVHDHGTKWFGPTWSHIDENLILRWTPTKTEFTTGLPVVIDLAACPMVMEELALIPQAERVGPLIVNPKTGFPYRHDKFHDVWRDVKEKIGLSAKVWSRDLRKSGSTEARAAGAPLDDVKKLMGHTADSDTTAKVYDLAVLEAHRRIAAARVASRKK